jgi:hypothetical protein
MQSMINTPERRRSQRFPLELPAELFVGKFRSNETTSNIGSGGLLISCTHDGAEVGSPVTVSMLKWPDSQPLDAKRTLVMEGIIVRREAGRVAIQRKRYEFALNGSKEMATARPA